MTKIVASAICLALIVTLQFVNCSSDQTDIQVNVWQNLTESWRSNPGIKLLNPVANGPSPKVALTYKTGERVNGDSLQATKIDWFTYNTPQDVKVTLSYPDSGTGAVVTFIQIDVEQSTNEGKAYISDGGIGQRKVAVIVESTNTLYFRYKAYIYGYK